MVVGMGVDDTHRASPLDPLHFLPATVAHGAGTLWPGPPLFDTLSLLVATGKTTLATYSLAE